MQSIDITHFWGKEIAEPKSVLLLLSGLKFQIELFPLDSGSHWKAPLLHLPAHLFLLISCPFSTQLTPAPGHSITPCLPAGFVVHLVSQSTDSGASLTGSLPVFPLISCVTLGKFLNSSVSLFPHL